MKRMRKLAAVGLVLMCTLSMLSLSANACYNAGTSCWDESCESFEYASISDDEVMERAAVCMICREGYLRYKVITIPVQISNIPCPKDGNYRHIIAVKGRVLLCDNCGEYGGADRSQSRATEACTNEPNCFKIRDLWNYEK